MGLNTRSKVLALALENIVGSTPAGSMTNVANMGLAFTEATLDPNPEFIDDRIVRQSFTPTVQQVTFKPAVLRSTFLFRGKASGTNVPAFRPFFDSAGFRMRATTQVPIGAITGGPFRHGEIVTQATSLATGMVMHDWYTGTGALLLEVLSGTFNGTDLITGGSSGATATASGGPTAVGYTWHPITEPIKRVDLSAVVTDIPIGAFVRGASSGAVAVIVERAVEDATPGPVSTTMYYRSYEGTFTAGEALDIVDGATNQATIDTPTGETYVSGAPLSARLYEDGVYKEARGGRTALTFDFAIGGQLQITAESQMVYTDEGNAANPTGISFDSRTSPLLQQIPLTIATDDATTEIAQHQVCLLQNLGLVTGPQIARRISACDAGGIREQFISGRTGTGSMNPEKQLEAQFPWLGSFTTGTPARIRVLIGTQAGNMLLASVPAAQFTQMNTGDRDGGAIYDVGFNLTGGTLGNLTGGSITLDSLGSDNEIVLTYFHTVPAI